MRNCNGLVIRARSVGSKPTISHQIRRRHGQEVRLKLDLAVLLAGDLAILLDDRAIVITAVAASVAKISPIRTAVRHVNVENGEACGVVVLVEDAFEFHIKKSGTFIKAVTTPWIETTALELLNAISYQPASMASTRRNTYLNDRVRSRRADSEMFGAPVRWQVVVWPLRWICAVESEGIAVMAINVNFRRCGSGNEWRYPSFVVDIRNDDASALVLVRNIIPIVILREWHIDSAAIFVLRL